MFRHRFHWPATIWLLLPALIGAPRLCAQAPALEHHVTLALVSALPDTNATATIVRESGPRGRTLIVLRERDADIATIATALRALQSSRLRQGDTLSTDVQINLHGRRSAKSLRDAERAAATDYLSRLRNAKPEELPGFGMAKTLEVSVGLGTRE